LKTKQTIIFTEDILYLARGGSRILPKRLKPRTTMFHHLKYKNINLHRHENSTLIFTNNIYNWS